MNLTPSSTTSETWCRTLKIPATFEWLGIFNSLITAGIYPYNWKQVNDTDLTPDEASAVVYAVLTEYAKSGQCNTDIAPYWEDDTDNQLIGAPPEDGQLWFGVIDLDENFQANLENVFIGAFVFELAGASAAAQFFVLAKAYRLAFRTGDWGGIVDVFVDAANVGTVDTYSAEPGLKYLDVIIPVE